MLEWQAPWGLLLGLTLPVIVLLYLLRRRRPRQRVPSLLLWRRALREEQANAPWQRLRPRLLLWLQLLAAAALALAAARPLWAGGGTGPVHRVVLLDASASMHSRDGGAIPGAAPGDTPAGEAGSSRFTAALGQVREIARGLAPGDALTVIRLDSQPRVLVAGATRPAQVEAALAGQAPGYGPADLTAGLALAAAVVGEEGPAEWILVSDGGLPAPERVPWRPGLSFRHVPVGSHGRNVAVTGLALGEGPGGLAAQAGVANLGDVPVAGILTLLAGDQTIGSRPFALAAGGRTYLTWGPLPPARSYEARLAGVPAADNALAHDDSAWAVPAEGGRPRVLLVSAGNRFLAQALAAHGGVEAFRVSPADYPTMAGGGFDLTIFDGWLPPAWPPGGALVVGVPAGGGTPALLAAGASFRPGSISFSRPDHPVLRHISWSDVHVGAARSLAPGDGWETLAAAPEGPLLAVQEAGASRRAVLAFSLRDSDLALRPAFPVLVANLVDWLAPRPAALPGGLRPGRPASLPPLPLAEALWVVGPDGTRTDLGPPWPPRPLVPGAPGLYRLVQSRGSTAGAVQESLLAVNGFDPGESQIAPAPFTLPGGPAGAAAGGPAPPSRRLLWPLLAAGALLVSFLEWWVDARGL